MRFCSHSVLACGVVLAIGMAATGGGEKGDDVKRIQGTWVVDPATFAEVKDAEALKEVLEGSKKVRVTFKGDLFTLTHPPANEEKVPFRLDSSKKPKQIDFGEGAQGIYELEGDTLKLCWDQQARKNGRPARFSLRDQKESVHYFVLRRAKPK